MSQGNYETSIIESSARTATVTTGDITNSHYRYLTLYVSVSADSGEDVTPRVEMKEKVSGNYTALWTAAAAISAVGEFNYQLGPGLLAAATGGYDDTENVVIPRTFRIVLAHAGSTSITYSASYGLNL